jgi:hypothetical protein
VELGDKVFTGAAVTTATKLVEMGVVDFTRVKVVGTALERVPGRVTVGVGTSSLRSESYQRESYTIGPRAASLVPGLTERYVQLYSSVNLYK